MIWMKSFSAVDAGGMVGDAGHVSKAGEGSHGRGGTGGSCDVGAAESS